MSKSDTDKLSESIVILTQYVTTLVHIVIAKGVCTEKELESVLSQATTQIDQHMARKQEEAEQQFAEQYPAIYKFFQTLDK